MELTQTLPAQGSAGENLYLHLESSNTVAAIHRDETPGKNSGKKTRRDIPGGRASSLHTVSRVSTKLLWLYKRFGIHSKIPKGSTAGGQRGTGPHPCWNLVSENAMSLVEKSIPRAGCMHSHRIVHLIQGSKPGKGICRPCPASGLHGNLSSGGILQEGRMGYEDRARQSREQPLCPALSCFYSLKKPPKSPPLLPQAVPKKAAQRFWLFVDLCLKPAQTFIPGSWENPKSF